MTQQKTCFALHEEKNAPCSRRTCKYWMNCDEHLNCVVLGAKDTHTLHDIGSAIGMTRFNVSKKEKQITQSLQRSLEQGA